MNKNFPRKDDPFLILAEALMGSNSSDAIVNSEARGQQELVNSEVLPKKGNGYTRAQLEQMGIKFGEDADDLFVYVTLPEGWKKVPTDHNMWSKLLDNKRRERLSIFYKAAFYDRDAFFNINRRYSYMVVPVDGWENKQSEWHCVVKDADTVIWTSATIKREPKYDKDKRDIWMEWMEKKDKLDSIGAKWLDEHYPDWKNPLAYWD